MHLLDELSLVSSYSSWKSSSSRPAGECLCICLSSADPFLVLCACNLSEGGVCAGSGSNCSIHVLCKFTLVLKQPAIVYLSLPLATAQV